MKNILRQFKIIARNANLQQKDVAVFWVWSVLCNGNLETSAGLCIFNFKSCFIKENILPSPGQISEGIKQSPC